MMRRPLAITILALYLIVVFGLSLAGNLVGSVNAWPPYSPGVWLLLAVPKMLALAAGAAFWKMLKLGAWLWGASIVSGWSLLFALNTGFFPSISIALVVSLAIIAASIWAIAAHWRILRPMTAGNENLAEAAE